MNYLEAQLPAIFGRRQKLELILTDLDIDHLAKKFNFTLDQSQFAAYQSNLLEFNFSKYKPIAELYLIDELIAKLLSISLVSKTEGPVPCSLAPIIEHQPVVEDYIEDFEILADFSGRIPGNVARSEFLRSGLPSAVLFRLWRLSDVDEDGALNLAEYAVMRTLIKDVANGGKVPRHLPESLRNLIVSFSYNLFRRKKL